MIGVASSVIGPVQTSAMYAHSRCNASTARGWRSPTCSNASVESTKGWEARVGERRLPCDRARGDRRRLRRSGTPRASGVEVRAERDVQAHADRPRRAVTNLLLVDLHHRHDVGRRAGEKELVHVEHVLRGERLLAHWNAERTGHLEHETARDAGENEV